MSASAGGSGMIDWDFAVQTARRLIQPGPQLTRDEVAGVIDTLRSSAVVAADHVRDYTGLEAAAAPAPVLVVDRTGWVQANADGFSRVVQPLVDKVGSRRGATSGPMSGMAGAVGSRVTGAEAGALLAFLSHKVLGQFDPFGESVPDGVGPATDGVVPASNGASAAAEDTTAPAEGAGTSAAANGASVVPYGASAGRLLLVAPNIVAAEREMEVDPDDFRLWVCLHEEAHRVQFTAVPWLRNHLLSEIEAFVAATEVDPDRLRDLVADGLRQVTDLVRGGSGSSLLDIFTSPEQQAVIDRVTAVMSLLEGHADVVMDGVGPTVIPSVSTIRTRFNKRRKGQSPSDRLLRRLLGLDAKMRQYAEGASFVNAVIDRVGMPGFNAVWGEPGRLPSAAEISDPEAWVRRVHG